MPLADTLQGTFQSDGFDLGQAMAGAGKVLDALAPAAPALDLQRIGALAQALSRGDTQAISAAVASAAQAAAARAAELPGVGEALGTLEAFTTGPAVDLLASARAAAQRGGAGTAAPGGLAATLDQLVAVGRLAAAPGAQALGQVVRLVLPGAGDPVKLVTGLAGQAPAVASALRLLGGLGALHASATRLLLASRAAATSLSPDAVAAALSAVRSAATALPARVAGAAADDAAAVAAAEQAVKDFLAQLEVLLTATPTGLLLAGAALHHFDASAIAGQVSGARALVLGVDLDPIRAAAEALRGRLDPLLSLPRLAPASAQAFAAEATRFGASLAQAVDAIDLAAVAGPALAGIRAVDDVARALEGVVDQAVAALRGVLEQVRGAVAAIDAAGIAAQIRGFLAPLAAALGQLQALVGAAVGELHAAASAAAAAIDQAVHDLGAALGVVEAAFKKLHDAVDALDVHALVDPMRPGIDAAVDALRKCQLAPYFDGAVGAMNDVRQVVAALPVGLLPGDARQKLQDLAQPIKSIDFGSAVRDPLEQQLAAILTSLDQDVLQEVQAAFEQVVTFLQGVDPRSAIAQLEHDRVDPALARLAALDPDQLLAPVTQALAPLESALAGFDPATLLAPVEQVFDGLLARFDALSPAALVAGPEARFTAARAQLESLVALDRWAPALEQAATAVDGALSALDAGHLVDALTASLDALLQASGGPAGATALLGPAVFQVLGGTGLSLRADSLAAAVSWAQGEDGASAVRGLLSGATAQLATARAAADAFDPVAVGAVSQPVYARVVAAVQALPTDHPLRVGLAPLLAGPSPLERLGPVAAQRADYLAQLQAAQDALGGLAGAGMSEIDSASQGLRAALRPLADAVDRLRGLAAQIGIDASGLDWRSLVAQVLAALPQAIPPQALQPALAALRAKLHELLVVRLIGGAKQAVEHVTQALAAFDLSALTSQLEAIHAQIRADLVALRPSSLLADLLAAMEALRQTLAGFDPLAPVRPVVDALKQAIAAAGQQLRPSVVLNDAVAAYEDVLTLVQALDVSQLLAPVLDELRAIEGQLDAGLDEASQALTALQHALP